MSYDAAVESIYQAKTRIRRERAVWRGNGTSPGKLKQEVLEQLSAALDYLEQKGVPISSADIESCTAEELVNLVDACFQRASLADQLDRELPRNPGRR